MTFYCLVEVFPCSSPQVSGTCTWMIRWPCCSAPGSSSCPSVWAGGLTNSATATCSASHQTSSSMSRHPSIFSLFIKLVVWFVTKSSSSTLVLNIQLNGVFTCTSDKSSADGLFPSLRFFLSIILPTHTSVCLCLSAPLSALCCVLSPENQCLSAVISNERFILFIDLMTPFVNGTVKAVSTVAMLKTVISLFVFS